MEANKQPLLVGAMAVGIHFLLVLGHGFATNEQSQQEAKAEGICGRVEPLILGFLVPVELTKRHQKKIPKRGGGRGMRGV